MQLVQLGIGAVYFFYGTGSFDRFVGDAEGEEGNEGDALDDVQADGKVFRTGEFYEWEWEAEEENESRSDLTRVIRTVV